MSSLPPGTAATLLKMTESELLVHIGSDLSEANRSAVQPSRSELIALANGWLEARRKQLQKVLCTDEMRKRLTALDNSADLLTLFDVLVGVVTGVQPATVAALILKRGIRTICGETRTSDRGCDESS